MKVNRKVVVEVVLDNDVVLKPGDTCIFLTKNNMCCYGVFQEVTARGSLMFAAHINGDIYKYAVMPSSIQEVEIVEM